MGNPALQNLESILCLKCGKSEWNVSAESIICNNCRHLNPIKDGHIVTTENYINEKNWEGANNSFEPLPGGKMAMNKLGGPRISELISKFGIKGLAINLGSGQDNYPGYINVDLGFYKPVHIVAELKALPFTDSSISLIASNSVLEHIYDYNKVIDEVYRVLKPDAYFYLCVPSVCARHHQYDYHRWTSEGLKELLKNRFEIVEQGACRGVAYVLIPYINYLIAYKIKNKFLLWLYKGIWNFISRPLFWINDDNNEQYQSLSQTIYILARKK